jgi:hypothetical protein
MDLLERKSCLISRHPWERARSKFFNRLIQKLSPTNSAVEYLDVGSGDAWFAAQLIDTLPSRSHITCWDINYEAEDLEASSCPSPGLTLTNKQPHSTFEGLLMLDVMEHVENDIEFISHMAEMCIDHDGWILVSVPAYQSLFTSHDAAVKHFRRYSPQQCARVLRSAGLTIEAQGGLFHSLLAVRGTQAAKERLMGPNEHWEGAGSWRAGRCLTRAVTTVLDAECRMSEALARTKTVLPGLSYWAFCRRSS